MDENPYNDENPYIWPKDQCDDDVEPFSNSRSYFWWREESWPPPRIFVFGMWLILLPFLISLFAAIANAHIGPIIRPWFDWPACLLCYTFVLTATCVIITALAGITYTFNHPAHLANPPGKWMRRYLFSIVRIPLFCVAGMCLLMFINWVVSQLK